MTVPEYKEWYYDHYGYYPSSEMVERFKKETGIQSETEGSMGQGENQVIGNEGP
jgi:hypothetical protein